MEASLEERLRVHSSYFVSLFSLVPAQYQSVRQESEEDGYLRGNKTRFWHNKKGAESLKLKGGNASESERGGGEGGTGFGVEERRSVGLSELQRRLREKMAAVSVRKRGGDSGRGRERKQQQRAEEEVKRREVARRNKEARQKSVAVAISREPAESSSSSPQFSFNRFDFNEDKDKAGQKKKKSYKSLIVKAEAKQRKLEELKEKDQERGGAAEDKERWSKAVRMARGEKVKDDPSLLKKTVKRLEIKKESRRRKWRERVRAEEERKEARQERRRENIRERVGQIKAKKNRKRAKKSGLI